MKIINAVPPIFDAIVQAGMQPHGHVLYTYGDELYIPSGLTPSDEIMAHEKWHSKQQLGIEGGRDAWWERYLEDPYFRMQQEAEAYAVQYNAYCNKVQDRNHRARYLHAIALQLSSPLYGKIISHSAATKLIRENL